MTRPVVLTLGTGPMVERLFKLSENKISVRTEALAGVTTFLTMAYIIFVQPNGLGATTIRLPQAPVPARAKVFLLSDALGVGKPESARCSTDKRPRRRVPKRMHSLGCA